MGINVDHICQHTLSDKVSLTMEDTGTLTRRFLAAHKLNFMGSAMEISVNENVAKSYLVDLIQEVFAEADTSKSCALYPTKQHKNYEECDMEFVRKSLGPDILPVWATTDDINKATGQQGQIKNWPDELTNIASGFALPPCKLPCTTTTGAIKENSRDAFMMPFITVVFGETIKITTTDFVPFSLANFLSSLGGSLGLWLGLGLLQLGQEGLRGLGLLLRAAQQQEAATNK